MTKGKDGSEMECLFYRLKPENKKVIITEAEVLVVQQEAQGLIKDSARVEVNTKK